MSNPFLGEIRMFGGTFAPAGWAFCDGQSLSISENDALFILIGTTYGGDGQTTFNLPNLQSRIPLHAGNGFTLAEMAGVETVTLTTQQLPIHTHPAQCKGGTNTGNSATPQNNVWASQSSFGIYTTDFSNPVPMNTAAMSPVGGSQPHDNMIPFLCISFIIALEGLFPSQT
jgi:microcystin-dependent protein